MDFFSLSQPIIPNVFNLLVRRFIFKNFTVSISPLVQEFYSNIYNQTKLLIMKYVYLYPIISLVKGYLTVHISLQLECGFLLNKISNKLLIDSV